MEKCPRCKAEKKGKYWCSACKAMFVCPMPNCGATITNPDAEECPRCGLLFEDYVKQRKIYRKCPKCKKKQGLNEQRCQHCRFWFNCPTCGHAVTSTSALSCPRCGTNLQR